jgi:hypothetical protein
LDERPINEKVALEAGCIADSIKGGKAQAIVRDFPSDNSLPPITFRSTMVLRQRRVLSAFAATSFPS